MYQVHLIEAEMGRTNRVVIPGIPHHITQRGVRRQQVFFSHDDYTLFTNLLRHFLKKTDLRVLAWCLMPNHYHILVTPPHSKSLAEFFAPLHRTYSFIINQREGWSGHLWQERYNSFPVDNDHTMAAARYIELNPLRAKLVNSPDEYPWSSAQAHLTSQEDGITDLVSSMNLQHDWKSLLESGLTDEEIAQFRHHENTNLPLGNPQFLEEIRKSCSIPTEPRKRGRPKTIIPWAEKCTRYFSFVPGTFFCFLTNPIS